MKLGENFVKYFIRFLGNGVLRKKCFWDLQTFMYTSILSQYLITNQKPILFWYVVWAKCFSELCVKNSQLEMEYLTAAVRDR